MNAAVNETKSLVSSTKDSNSQFRTVSGRSFIYRVKSRGLRMKPWDTQCFTGKEEESEDPMRVH